MTVNPYKVVECYLYRNILMIIFLFVRYLVFEKQTVHILINSSYLAHTDVHFKQLNIIDDIYKFITCL